VTLYGHGVLRGQSGVKEMMPIFQDYCVPPKQPNIHGQLRPTRGTPGYKENTLTLPKELTLVCETDKGKTRRAVTAAIDQMLEAVYEGKDIAAVSAMHTKNKVGEPHLNVHLLVGKFGQRRDNEKWGSLNYAGFYDDKNAKDAAKIRGFWTKFIILELQKEFGVTVSFDEKGKCQVTTKERVPIEALTKATRRERQIAYAESKAPRIQGKKGAMIPIKINMMDAKILETAARDILGRDSFVALFPSYQNTYHTIEKRIETLKSVGFLNDNLRPTNEFREYAEIVFGWKPEYGQLKADVDNFVRQMADSLPRESLAAKPQEATREPEREDAGNPMEAEPTEMPEAKPNGRETRRQRNEKAKTEAKRRLAENPMSLEAAIHRHPLVFAQLNPYLRSRIARLNPTPGQLQRIEAELAQQRKMVTPEMRKWVETEQTVWNYIAESNEKIGNMTKAEYAEFKPNNDRIRMRLEANLKEQREKAELAVGNPNRPETAVILREIRLDTDLLESLQNRIQHQTHDRNHERESTGPNDRNNASKRYGAKINGLAKIAEKIKAELDEKTLMASQIDSMMPVPTAPRHWRLVMRSKATSAFTAQAMMPRQNVLRRKELVRKWMSQRYVILEQKDRAQREMMIPGIPQDENQSCLRPLIGIEVIVPLTGSDEKDGKESKAAYISPEPSEQAFSQPTPLPTVEASESEPVEKLAAQPAMEVTEQEVLIEITDSLIEPSLTEAAPTTTPEHGTQSISAEGEPAEDTAAPTVITVPSGELSVAPKREQEVEQTDHVEPEEVPTPLISTLPIANGDDDEEPEETGVHEVSIANHTAPATQEEKPVGILEAATIRLEDIGKPEDAETFRLEIKFAYDGIPDKISGTGTQDEKTALLRDWLGGNFAVILPGILIHEPHLIVKLAVAAGLSKQEAIDATHAAVEMYRPQDVAAVTPSYHELIQRIQDQQRERDLKDALKGITVLSPKEVVGFVALLDKETAMKIRKCTTPKDKSIQLYKWIEGKQETVAPLIPRVFKSAEGTSERNPFKLIADNISLSVGTVRQVFERAMMKWSDPLAAAAVKRVLDAHREKLAEDKRKRAAEHAGAGVASTTLGNTNNPDEVPNPFLK